MKKYGKSAQMHFWTRKRENCSMHLCHSHADCWYREDQTSYFELKSNQPLNNAKYWNQDKYVQHYEATDETWFAILNLVSSYWVLLMFCMLKMGTHTHIAHSIYDIRYRYIEHVTGYTKDKWDVLNFKVVICQLHGFDDGSKLSRANMSETPWNSK